MINKKIKKIPKFSLIILHNAIKITCIDWIIMIESGALSMPLIIFPFADVLCVDWLLLGKWFHCDYLGSEAISHFFLIKINILLLLF